MRVVCAHLDSEKVSRDDTLCLVSHLTLIIVLKMHGVIATYVTRNGGLERLATLFGDKELAPWLWQRLGSFLIFSDLERANYPPFTSFSLMVSRDNAAWA